MLIRFVNSVPLVFSNQIVWQAAAKDRERRRLDLQSKLDACGVLYTSDESGKLVILLNLFYRYASLLIYAVDAPGWNPRFQALWSRTARTIEEKVKRAQNICTVILFSFAASLSLVLTGASLCVFAVCCFLVCFSDVCE